MNIPNEVLLTSVTAQLSYVDEESEPQEDKPYQIISDVGPHSVPKINFRFRTYEAETITNIRGYEREFALDTHGFSFHSVTTRFTEWDSQELVETKYFQEVENLLKTFVDGADHIEIFDWRVRKHQNATSLDSENRPHLEASQLSNKVTLLTFSSVVESLPIYLGQRPRLIVKI